MNFELGSYVFVIIFKDALNFFQIAQQQLKHGEGNNYKIYLKVKLTYIEITQSVLAFRVFSCNEFSIIFLQNLQPNRSFHDC